MTFRPLVGVGPWKLDICVLDKFVFVLNCLLIWGACCLVGDGHEPTDQLFTFEKTQSLGGISLSLSDQHQAYGLSQPWAKKNPKTPTYAKSQHW